MDVVVFAYNNEATIEKCLTSIISQQFSGGLRVMVHDDCSEDRTVKIARSCLEKWGGDFLIQVATVNRYQSGPGFRWEFLALASSEYIAFLDGDDYWVDPEKLEKQTTILAENPEAALCHSSFFLEQKIGSWEACHPPHRFRHSILPGTALADTNFIGTCTVVIRREFLPLDALDGYEKCHGVDDYPMWAICTDRRQIAWLNDLTAVYRISDSQHYNSLSQEKKDQYLKNALDFISRHVHPENKKIWLGSYRRALLGRGVTGFALLSRKAKTITSMLQQVIGASWAK